MAEPEPSFESEHQRRLFKRLREADTSPTSDGNPRPFQLGSIYLGLLVAAADRTNPDRIALTAHSARELMDKVAMYIDVPIPQEKSLTQAVKNLTQEFQPFRADVEAFSGTGRLEMSEERLQRFKLFSRSMIRFFEDFRNSYRSAVQKARALFAKTDPRAREQADALRLEQAAAWIDLNQWFKNVAHHGRNPTADELREKLQSLETVLMGVFPEFAPVAEEMEDILDKYQ